MERQREDGWKTATAALHCECEGRRNASLLLSLRGCKHPESFKTAKQQQLAEM